MAQRFSSTGTKEGSEYLVSADTLVDRKYPSVAALDGDECVIAWSNNVLDGNGYGIFAAIDSASTSYPTSVPTAVPTSVPTTPASKAPTSVRKQSSFCSQRPTLAFPSRRSASWFPQRDACCRPVLPQLNDSTQHWPRNNRQTINHDNHTSARRGVRPGTDPGPLGPRLIHFSRGGAEVRQRDHGGRGTK